jgi:glycosyltransferase involved in cell wall biosynthesis
MPRITPVDWKTLLRIFEIYGCQYKHKRGSHHILIYPGARLSGEKNLEHMIAEMGLENRVFIKETVPIEQIARVMANVALGIIPKRNDPFGGEAFSTKILEFMSLGVPVIVSETKIDKFYLKSNTMCDTFRSVS